MNTLLHIDSSLFGDNGQSSQLARQFVQRWANGRSGARIIYRSLTQQPLPHLDETIFGSFSTPEDDRTEEQRAHVARSNRLIEELRSADLIVFGLPMYNFGVPSQLKAWMDHVARAGETFRYTENGPQGLITGKRAVIIRASGGKYAGTDMDLQTGFVRQFLAFIGITEVEFVYAEGLAMGNGERDRALAQASEQLESLVA